MVSTQVKGTTSLTIQIALDEVVPYQVTPAPANFDYTGKTISKYDLVFLAEDLPAFGMKVYFISNLDTEDKNSTVVPDNSETRFTLGDEVRYEDYPVNNETNSCS